MGFLDLFNSQSPTPRIHSVLPAIAKQQILRGQLPILQPNNLFLKQDEICHYADRAIYEKRIVNKRRVRKNNSYSVPGLFKGHRIHLGGGNTQYVNDVCYTKVKGFLYITTRRIIFVGGHDGFDRKLDELVAITPYANCIELQFDDETLRLFVPDGNLSHMVLRLI